MERQTRDIIEMENTNGVTLGHTMSAVYRFSGVYPDDEPDEEDNPNDLIDQIIDRIIR